MPRIAAAVYATPDDVLDNAVVANIALALRESLSAPRRARCLAIGPALMKRLSAAGERSSRSPVMDDERSISRRPETADRELAGDAPLVEFAAADEVLLTKT